jgi:hypothetical protein
MSAHGTTIFSARSCDAFDAISVTTTPRSLSGTKPVSIAGVFFEGMVGVVGR